MWSAMQKRNIHLKPIEQAVLWSVAPPDAQTAVQIEYFGESGQRQLTIPKADAPWQQVVTVASRAETELFETLDVYGEAVRQWAAAIGARQATTSERSTWTTALGAMEVVDAIELSLERGRMIEVFHQRLTEQLAFKGVMSAFGCGLLLLAMLVLFAVGIFGDALGIPGVHYWPLVTLALLTLFLLLQLVPVTRSSTPKD